LIIVLSSILLVQYFGLHILNLKVVGEISKGLPSFNIPNLNWNKISSLLPLASTLAVISFIESFSISKKIDTKSRDYKLNANTELVALGSANFMGSFFMSFPVTGGFGRSAVNYAAGAQTPFSGFISASLIATTLLFFTDIFELLPYTVLAAIILVALAGLVDFKYHYKLWKANSIDFFMLILTFLITLLFGMISGVFSGMLLYVLLLTYKLFFPQVHHQTFAKTKGKLPTNNNMSIASPHQSLYIFKIDTPVFTFNSKSIKKQIIQKIIIPNSNRQTLLIDLSTIQHIDGRGLKGIKLLISELYEKNIRILWLKLHPKIHSIFTYKKLINGPLEDNVFKNVTAAMEFLKKEDDK
jgi:SulP family sulfate permease